jgi:hypothetical protein
LKINKNEPVLVEPIEMDLPMNSWVLFTGLVYAALAIAAVAWVSAIRLKKEIRDLSERLKKLEEKGSA